MLANKKGKLKHTKNNIYIYIYMIYNTYYF